MLEPWRRIPVPSLCERMIGFSVPQGETVLVLSQEGRHLVSLNSPVTVETNHSCGEYDHYNPVTGICRYMEKTWQIIGLHPGHPILGSPQGEWLELDETAETVSVFLGTKEIWSASFENFSGDWAAATFSPDGRFIVLGCPYDFDFRVWQRVANPPRAAGLNPE